MLTSAEVVNLVMKFFDFLFGRAKIQIPASIYEFKVPALNGSIIDFSQFRGKKLLIVNTASKCGFTHQYEGLERLYTNYKDKLVVIAFPSNNFLFQEPGSNEIIATFCKTKYNITFPVAAKVSVKGWNKAPIYHWLTAKRYNGHADSKVKWNFQKYLIDEHGQLAHIFSPKTDPEGPEITAAIGKD
jgi:glutathione peroxidase